MDKMIQFLIPLLQSSPIYIIAVLGISHYVLNLKIKHLEDDIKEMKEDIRKINGFFMQVSVTKKFVDKDVS